jgi:hypothetical protein
MMMHGTKMIEDDVTRCSVAKECDSKMCDGDVIGIWKNYLIQGGMMGRKNVCVGLFLNKAHG